MCDNVITLYIFMILKFIILIILPIIIIIKRKKDYSKILIIVNIVLLLILLICNTFSINKCVYNSTLSGVQRAKNKNNIDNYLSMHPTNNIYTGKMIPAIFICMDNKTMEGYLFVFQYIKYYILKIIKNKKN